MIIIQDWIRLHSTGSVNGSSSVIKASMYKTPDKEIIVIKPAPFAFKDWNKVLGNAR